MVCFSYFWGMELYTPWQPLRNTYHKPYISPRQLNQLNAMKFSQRGPQKFSGFQPSMYPMVHGFTIFHSPVAQCLPIQQHPINMVMKWLM